MTNLAKVFRFPRHLPLLGLLLAVAIGAAGWLSGAQVKPLGSLLMACLPAAILACSVWAWRYEVEIDADVLRVGAFGRRVFPLSQVAEIKVSKGRNGRSLAVSFRNGRKLLIPAGLRGFDELLEVLSQQTGITVSRPIWQ